MKDVFMSGKQNKPFHSSMSTRNHLVSSTGKFETIGSNFRQETRCSEATAVLCYYTRKGN